MSNLDDLFKKYKTQYYEDLPHSRTRPSKYFGRPRLDIVGDSMRASRAVVFRDNQDLRS